MFGMFVFRTRTFRGPESAGFQRIRRNSGWYSLCLSSKCGWDLGAARIRPADRHVENVAGGKVVPRPDCSSTGRGVCRLVCQRASVGTSRLRRLRRCAPLVRATANAELGRGLASVWV